MSNIVGGLFFGVGMILSGGCSGSTWYRVGEGAVGAWVVLVGFAIGGPLSDGLTPWIATPLLIIGVLFGLLLMTGTTIREVPSALSTWLGVGAHRDDDEYYDDEYDDAPEQSDDFSDGYYDDPDGYFQAIDRFLAAHPPRS